MVRAASSAIAAAIAALSLMATIVQAMVPAMPALGDEGPTDPAVSASTGSANFRISIDVPPGPGGLTPSLALSYSSRNGDGPYGVGWNLQLGEVRCSTRFGVPDYANCKKFELNGQLITRDGTSNSYHSFVETFQQIEYLSGSQTWEVTNPNGTIQRYGVNADARVMSGANVARWLLSEIQDPFGNTIYITYDDTMDIGTHYPSRITYGAGATKAAGKRSVEFFFDEIRPDPIHDYAGGIEREITRRITEIKVSSYGVPVRRYAFGFDGLDETGAAFAYTTGRSRLGWVQQFGDDCTGLIASCTGGLPRQEYVYTDSTDDGVTGQFSKFTKGETYTPTPAIPKLDNWVVELGGNVVKYLETDKDAVRIADINGDGLPDLIEGGTRNGYLGDKSPTVDGNGNFVPGQFDTIDPIPSLKIRLNTGSGFTEDSDWTTAFRNLQVARPRVDFVQIMPVESGLYRDVLHWGARAGIIDASPGASTVQYTEVTRSISSAWQATSARPEALYSVDGDDSLLNGDPTPGWIEGLGRLHFTDVNGDGLADIIVSVQLSGVDKNVTPNGTPIDPALVQREPGMAIRKVYRNTGDPTTGGWEEDPDLAAGLPPFGIVQFESELGAEQRIPFGVGPDASDPLSVWPTATSGSEKSGFDWLNPAGVYFGSPCASRGLYGSMASSDQNLYYPPTIPDFCSNLVNLDPRFMDLNGDGFVDLMVLEMDDSEALHQGPYGGDSGYHRGYLAPSLPPNTARSVAWIQVPDAPSGQDRWVRAPQYDLPNVPFMTPGNGGNLYPGIDLPFSHSQPNLRHPEGGYSGCPGTGIFGSNSPSFPDFSICAPLAYNLNTGVQFVDVNRDGLTDVVWSLYDYQDLPTSYPEKPLISQGALLNTGTGWCSSTPEMETQNVLSQCPHASMYYPPANDGTGDEAGFGFYNAVNNGSSTGQLVDLNADGFLDYIQMHTTPQWTGNRAWIFDPGGAAAVPQNMWIRDDRYDLDIDFIWIEPAYLLGLVALDVNGDGAVDIVGDDIFFEDRYPSGDNKEHPQTFVSDATKPHHSDLIRLVRNGRGGEIAIEYQSAIVQRDSAIINPPGSVDLEAEAVQHASDTLEELGTTIADLIRWTASPVVSEVRIKGPNRAPDPSAPSPGFGHPTKYRYAHPRFCVGSQSDLGYRVVERTRPAGEVITSKYYQTHGRAGKTAEVVVSEGGVDVHYYREYWETQEQPAQLPNRNPVPTSLPGSINHPAVHVGRLAHIVSRAINDSVLGAQQQSAFYYDDSYGYNFVENLTEKRATGSLAIWRAPGSDPANGLFGLVVEERKFDYLNSTLASTDFLEHTTIGYDRGRPSSVSKMVKGRDEAGGGAAQLRSMSYDGYGNLASQTVHATAGDRVTNFYYDGDVDPGAVTWPGAAQSSHSVRVGVMDSAGGIASSIPDSGTGAIVETSSTYTDEPSSKLTLDAFGRPVESFVYDGTAWLKTSKAEYDDLAFTPRVVTRFEYPDSSADDLEAIWSSVVSDGFGGTWKEIGETPDGFVGTFTYHDPFARTVRRSLPFFCSDGSCDGHDGSTEPKASLTEVDAIGRPVRTDTPYGFSVFEHFSVPGGTVNGPFPSVANQAFDVVLEKNGKGDLIQRGMDGDRIAWVEECDNTVLPSTADLSGMVCTGASGTPATTFYSYEGTGELSAILDARSNGSFSDPNHFLQYHYDTLGRVVQIDDPALAGIGSSQTTYDPYGNILAVTNARGQIRTHSYDSLNRLTGIATPATETDYTVTYSAGQRQASGDSSDDYVRSLVFDGLGRVQKEHMQVDDSSGSLRSYHTDFSYDLVGRVTEVLYPAKHYDVYGWQDTVVRYEYDRGFLEQICDLGSATDCDSATTKYVRGATFDSLGRATAMAFPNGTRTFAYDPTTQRLSQDHFSSSSYSYTRNYGIPDEIGNVVSITGSESATPALDMEETYTYDQRNRISTWTKEGASYAYAYDDLGNLTTHADEVQEYDLIRPHAITRRDLNATIPTVYSYDDDGNVESIVGESTAQYFEFDSANQAVCLSSTSSSCDTRVAYDISGQRIAEYLAANQYYRAYIGESFLYEGFGLNPKASVEVMLDGKRIALKRFDPQVRGATAGAWVVYVPPPSWIAGGLAGASLWLVILGLRNGTLVLVRRRPFRAATAFAAAISLFIPSLTLAGGAGAADPPTYFWEISDPLGTGMVMLSAGGNRVRHQVFTPFGAMHDETGANFRTFYAGHRRDEASGMFYMQARWYDPGSGRFLSVDPLIRSAGIPQSANPYSYAENNPVNGVDPTGEAYAKPCGGGCTEYYFSGSSYAASFGSDVVGTYDTTDSEGSTVTNEISGSQLSKVSEGGIQTLFASNGQTFGAVGDGSFAAGVAGFFDGGTDLSIFTSESVSPTAGDASDAEALVVLLNEIPALVSKAERIEKFAADSAGDGRTGRGNAGAALATNIFRFLRHQFAENVLRRRLGLPRIDRLGIRRLGDFNALRTPESPPRDLTALNREIAYVRRRGGLDQ